MDRHLYSPSIVGVLGSVILAALTIAYGLEPGMAQVPDVHALPQSRNIPVGSDGPTQYAITPPFASAGTGVTEKTQVKDFSRAPFAPNSKNRTGFKFVGGIGPPNRLSMSGAIEADPEHILPRTGYLPTNEPTNLWSQGITLGVELHY